MKRGVFKDGRYDVFCILAHDVRRKSPRVSFGDDFRLEMWLGVFLIWTG